MKRWITGIAMAVGVLLLLVYAPMEYLKALVLALSLVACWEFLTITSGHKKWIRLLGVFLTLVGGLILLDLRDVHHILLFLYAVIALAFVTQFPGSTPTTEKIKHTAFFVLAIFYSVFLFGTLASVAGRPDHRFWLLLAIACTYVGDTGAYMTGRLCGRRKLAPVISPGKTVEGAVGAVFGGVIAAFVVWQIFAPGFGLAVALCLGGVIAVVGILGDLAESLLKRGFGVKDSGTLIPGHGGVLDRLDSLLFTGPLVYFVSHYV